MADFKWWGYLHQNNSIQVKRFFDQRDLDEARQSPFVKSVWLPFHARNREEALNVIQEHINCKNSIYNAACDDCQQCDLEPVKENTQ